MLDGVYLSFLWYKVCEKTSIKNWKIVKASRGERGSFLLEIKCPFFVSQQGLEEGSSKLEQYPKQGHYYCTEYQLKQTIIVSMTNYTPDKTALL